MTEDRLAPPTFDPADAAAAAQRFAASAPADVHYALVDSPIGTLVAAATPRGLATLSYEDFNGGVDAVLDSLAAKLSPRMLEAPARLDDVRRELDEYFEGRRREFDLPIDWALASSFGRRVLTATAAIPFGQVSTYGKVAAQAGNPKASRAAGRALGANPIPIVVPCHRVVGARGRLTGYTGGLHRKVALLEIEGVVLPT
jgi:methylated-DNA-[protein]-cysteine S-methyltransferase